jgi:hypothetical protein
MMNSLEQEAQSPTLPSMARAEFDLAIEGVKAEVKNLMK